MTIEEAAAAIAFAMADHTGEEALDVLLHAARMSVKYREVISEIAQAERLPTLEHGNAMHELIKSLPHGWAILHDKSLNGNAWHIGEVNSVDFETYEGEKKPSLADTLDEALLAWQNAQGEKK